MKMMDCSWDISNLKRWCCESVTLNMSANLKNSAVATELENVSFLSNPKKAIPKNVSTITLILHANTITLKILQTRLHQYLNWELPVIQTAFHRGRGTRDQLPIFARSWRKQGESRKISCSASLTMLFPLTVWITTNCGKFLKWWQYQTILSVSWENCIQAMNNS